MIQFSHSGACIWGKLLTQKDNMPLNVHSSTVYNSQDMKQPTRPTKDEWINMWYVRVYIYKHIHTHIYAHNGLLLSHKIMPMAASEPASLRSWAHSFITRSLGFIVKWA